MKSNVGLIDRYIRVLAGIILLGWAFAFPETPYSWLGYLGVIPLATGVIGWCGLYSLLGLSTRSNS